MINQLHISTFRLNELDDLLQLMEQKKWTHLPTNQLRVASYRNNPRAKPTDVVAIMAEAEGELVSFRTLLPDHYHSEGKVIRFAWNSGSWTHPAWRRKGLSKLLFVKVYEAWDGLLAYSNFAPNSHQLNTASNRYEMLCELNGSKFFIKSDLETVFAKRMPSLAGLKSLIKPFDGLINILQLKKTPRLAGQNINFEPIEEALPESFYKQVHFEKTGFLRGNDELNWIIRNPWISADNTWVAAQKKYPFTLKVQRAVRHCYKIISNGNEIGFLMLFLKNSQLTVPYLHLLESTPETLKKISYFIYNQSIIHRIKTLLIANEALSVAYQKTKLYKYRVQRKQAYYVTKKLGKAIGTRENMNIYDGDGDHVFSN